MKAIRGNFVLSLLKMLEVNNGEPAKIRRSLKIADEILKGKVSQSSIDEFILDRKEKTNETKN